MPLSCNKISTDGSPSTVWVIKRGDSSEVGVVRLDPKMPLVFRAHNKQSITQAELAEISGLMATQCK